MNKEKAEALLKWVQTMNLQTHVSSLQELSNPKILVEIISFIDPDILDVQNDSAENILNCLERFYHQPLDDVLDPTELGKSADENYLNIGKILSLILCMSVQADNAFECIEKITSLNENLQNQIRVIIEAVLKDCDNGKINPNNMNTVLCQSDSLAEVEISKDSYLSPMSMSPIPLSYNSPIKALMASPQMLSRKSQVNISKLYKRLNQFQMQINRLKRTQIDLEDEVEQKGQLLNEKDMTIQLLTKEALKVAPLLEEVDSLTNFEGEVNEINTKHEKLKKYTRELEKYKDDFCRLEKDFNILVNAKEAERQDFEREMKVVQNKHVEEMESMKKLLQETNETCECLTNQLEKIKAEKEECLKKLTKQEDFYRTEITRIENALAKSETSRQMVILKSDQDVLRQIARESDLKQCFREQEAVLQASIDDMMVENTKYKQEMECLQQSLQHEMNEKKCLQLNLTSREDELSEAHAKYSALLTQYNSLEHEQKESIEILTEAKRHLTETNKIRSNDEPAVEKKDDRQLILTKTTDVMQEYICTTRNNDINGCDGTLPKQTSSIVTVTSTTNDEKLEEKVGMLMEKEKLVEDNKRSKEELEQYTLAEMRKQVEISEKTMEKLNDDNVELELQLLSMRDEIKQLKHEKRKMEEYVEERDKTITNLEKRLSEEEFINKRLAVEVRSADAQLAYADRQLRKVNDEEMTRSKIGVDKTSNDRNISAINEENSSESLTENPSIANESIISHVSMNCEENRRPESFGYTDNLKKETEDPNQTSFVLSQQHEVLKTLRRRSAVYSKKNCRKDDVMKKRYSTVGTESFVVGQFSSTVAEEPDQHFYEWDRIMELQKRNSSCVRHLRSSYPVETQVCPKEEFHDDDLKSGGISNQSRKRQIDEVLRNSKNSQKPSLRSNTTKSVSRFEQNPDSGNKILKPTNCSTARENIEANNCRESIAFKIDITPAKKARKSLKSAVVPSSSSTASAAQHNEKVNNKSKRVPVRTTKKYSLQVKSSSLENEKKKWRSRRTNLAV